MISKRLSVSTFDKYFTNDDSAYSSSSGDSKSSTTRLKQNAELYSEADNIPGDLIQVKRINKKEEERWEIYKNKQLALSLPAIKFSNKDKEYFRTAEGVLHIIGCFKKGAIKLSDYKMGKAK